MDHSTLNVPSDLSASWLEEMKGVAVKTNGKVAKDLDIPISTAITCVKPQVRYRSWLALRRASTQDTHRTMYAELEQTLRIRLLRG